MLISVKWHIQRLENMNRKGARLTRAFTSFPLIWTGLVAILGCSTSMCQYSMRVAFGRFRPASTWRHNPVPFISQVPGGYYTGNTPPFIPVFALFIFRLLQTANRRPRPTNSYTIPLRWDGSSQDSSSVVNGRFFVVSFADSLFLA